MGGGLSANWLLNEIRSEWNPFSFDKYFDTTVDFHSVCQRLNDERICVDFIVYLNSAS